MNKAWICTWCKRGNGGGDQHRVQPGVGNANANGLQQPGFLSPGDDQDDRSRVLGCKRLIDDSYGDRRPGWWTDTAGWGAIVADGRSESIWIKQE